MLIRFPNHSPQLPWAIPDVSCGDYYTYRDPRTDVVKYVYPQAMNDGGVFAMVDAEQAGISPASAGLQVAGHPVGGRQASESVGNLGVPLGTIESTIEQAAAETVEAAEAAQSQLVQAVTTDLPAAVSLPPLPSVTLREVGVVGLIAIGAMLVGNWMHRREGAGPVLRRPVGGRPGGA